MIILSDLSEVFIHGMFGTEDVIAKRFGAEAGKKFWARHLVVNDDFFQPVLRGKLPEDRYWEEFFKEGEYPFTLEDAKAAFTENMRRVIPGTLKMYQRIIAYPRSLGPESFGLAHGMPTIYIVSDHIAERIQWLYTVHPDIFRIVDRHYWSCAIGMIKQDPEFFPGLLRELAIDVNELLFIDDMDGNVAAAERVGIRGIRFETAEQVERDLAKLGFVFAPKAP